jgi:hypothetical protein
MKAIPPVHVIFHSIEKAGSAPQSQTLFNTISNITGLLLIGIAASSMFRWRKDSSRSNRLQTGFLLLFGGLMLLSYSSYIFGSYFFVRYYFPLYFTGSIIFAFMLQDLFDWYRRRSKALRVITASAAVVYASAFLYFSWSQSFRSFPVYPFYDIAKWVDSNVERGETVGVLQCGTIGYFSKRQVINLDGKVNREAVKALKEQDLIGYAEKEEIDIIIDHSRILEIFLDLSPVDLKESCTAIPWASKRRPTGWIAFRPQDLEIN